MFAQSPSTAIALPQSVTETAPEFDGKFSLNRIAAVLQVVLATRRAAASTPDSAVRGRNVSIP